MYAPALRKAGMRVATRTIQTRSASLAAFKTPAILNEPNQHYGKGTAERKGLTEALEKLKAQKPADIPVVVGGKEIRTSAVYQQLNPSDHSSSVAQYHKATAEDVNNAIEAALAAKPAWEALPFADRAAVFLKAADLVANKYRYEIMAATMLGQGKNAWQAEIDAAAELADFYRFGVHYAETLYNQQPAHNANGVWNRLEYRPLEGFVYAVSPFNFTAIGGNLAGAPVLMGNVCVWKPSDNCVAASYLVYKILLEAGLPKDVIQFIPGEPVEVTKTVLAHKEFASLHFTGSTQVFRNLYGQIGEGVAEGRYRSYPRIVGETGGKNFHLVHNSADLDNVAINTIRGAFEYQGQKCSATSRLYAPKSVWPELKEKLITETKAIKQGAPWEHENFMGPVIHEGSFNKLKEAIDAAKSDSELKLVVGGTYDNSKGYYVQPTIYETTNPNHPYLSKEFFGPIITTYVYDDAAPDAFTKACELVDTTSEYGLTGSVFAADRTVIRHAEEKLRNAAGNFYINCKSTGAVVGQQPFGGARASGTDDKAGSQNLLLRFVNVRTIKEEFSALPEVEYPSNKI